MLTEPDCAFAACDLIFFSINAFKGRQKHSEDYQIYEDGVSSQICKG
jgi:hypothetical protein